MQDGPKSKSDGQVGRAAKGSLNGNEVMRTRDCISPSCHRMKSPCSVRGYGEFDGSCVFGLTHIFRGSDRTHGRIVRDGHTPHPLASTKHSASSRNLRSPTDPSGFPSPHHTVPEQSQEPHGMHQIFIPTGSASSDHVVLLGNHAGRIGTAYLRHHGGRTGSAADPDAGRWGRPRCHTVHGALPRVSTTSNQTVVCSPGSDNTS